MPRFGHPATSKIKRDAREDWEMKRADCGGPRCRNADHDKQDGYVEHQKSQVTDMATDLKYVLDSYESLESAAHNKIERLKKWRSRST